MIQKSRDYQALYNTDKRYILITGGRGSGKSFEVGTFLSLLTYEQKHRILFTRYTMASAGISIIPEFMEKIELLEVPHHFDINKSEITDRQTGRQTNRQTDRQPDRQTNRQTQRDTHTYKQRDNKQQDRERQFYGAATLYLNRDRDRYNKDRETYRKTDRHADKD